jgi:bla regulator protein blaR1
MTLIENILDTWAVTLVHSLWQGLLVLAVVRIILKLVPASKAELRYGVAVMALVFFTILSALTFYTTLPTTSSSNATLGTGLSMQGFIMTTPTEGSSWTTWLSNLLLQYSSTILTVWLFGASLFLLRLSGSWWYIKHLTDTGNLVTGEWKTKVDQLALRLGVNKAISLIESSRIDAPFVVGVLHPIIFIPVHIGTGMSTEQLEAIFIHEIIHVKRHDYLINLFQSLIESMYFFNPFIWKISDMIKTEREHCCDDAVVKFGADKKAYVYALASLEESRHYKNALALSAAGNKNQLFNRIKRLMEGPTKNYSLREKLVPAVLLVVGLMCASWFSVNRGPAPMDSTINLNQVGIAADTIIKKKEKTKPENEKTKTEKDKTKTEKTNSEANVDEELMVFPPVPDIDIPVHPDFEPPDLEIMIPMEPDIHIYAGDYQAEFMERFKERFGEFYEKNQAELERMVAEIEKEKFAHVDLATIEADAKVHQVMAEHHQEIRRAQEVNLQKQEETMKEAEAQMKVLEKENEKRMQKFELEMKEFEKQFEVFNEKLRVELVRDGYLEKDEKLDNIRIKDDDLIEINGKQIKQSDLKKYQEFFKNNSPKSPPHPK